MKTNIIYKLRHKADGIRKGILESVYSAQSGHPGGSMSIAEILSVLYFSKMKIDPENPNWEKRDRLVLSKGHAAPALYSALALAGYFDAKELKKLRRLESFLQGHPDSIKTPGVDATSGSLGQGISAACGMALIAKRRQKDFYVYCILGDGETGEGQVWEAVMMAAHYHLDNLIVFLDLNGLQIDGTTLDVMNTAPLDTKFGAFNWNVIKADGHDVNALSEAIDEAKSSKGKPTVIICKTIKGKGISYMENNVAWHGKAPNSKEYEQGLMELEGGLIDG